MSTAYTTQRTRTHLWLLWMIGAALVVAPSAPAHEELSEKEVWAFRTHLRPTIDGVLEDADWKRATPATGFILTEPEEGVAATNQTFIHILYDADYLYIGLNMMDAEPSNIKSRIMQRDSPLAPLDLVGLVLDTYHDHQNAYGFYINAYGVQSDFRVENDGWGGIDSSWDAIWQAETHIHDQGWSAETAIPFGIQGSWIEPKFNVDQIGFIPHDADVGEREFGLYGSYGWRPDFLGIRNIYLRQDLVAERRTNEEGWEWRWSNVDVYVRRLDDSRAWFGHYNWQLRWQQKKYNGDSFNAGIQRTRSSTSVSNRSPKRSFSNSRS